VNLSSRDRRALALLGASLVLIVMWRWLSSDDKSSGTVSASSDMVSATEQRLARLRLTAANVPGRQEALDKVKTELATREKGILTADTPAQAQAQLFQILRRIGKGQAKPIEFGGTEIGQVKTIDNNYGEVLVSVSFSSNIDQLLNLLADIANQKELISTSEIRAGQAHPKEKTFPVRLTISGIVRKDLIPDKKAITNF
jgi:hypothetical protein